MRNPDFVGPFGRAWALDTKAIAEKEGVPPEQNCMVGVWVVHAPTSHPLWPWYRVSIVSLADKPGVPPPKLYLEGATHELVVSALNPDHYPPSVDEMPRYTMVPTNFASQLRYKSDEEAHDIIQDGVVKAIVHGFLNPDTDGRSQWETLFGDNMIRKDW